MAGTIRLNKVLRELNISIDRAVDFLESKGVEIEKRPTTKITSEVYEILCKKFKLGSPKNIFKPEDKQLIMNKLYGEEMKQIKDGAY